MEEQKREGAAISPAPSLPRSQEEAADEIERILHQMLLLAEMSAGDGSVDRDALQKAIARLRDKIDRIADSIA